LTKADITEHRPDHFQAASLTRYHAALQNLGGAMRRREFITFVGSSAVAWPLAAHAQRQPMPVIGFLNGQSAATFQYLVAAFQTGLSENGFVENQNVTIEYRWADGHVERLPELASDLVQRQPALLIAAGGAHFAAIAATKTIPIIATFGSDPIKTGFVASLNKPGGNVTGMMILSSDLEAKRLELLHEIVQRGASLGYLLDPKFDAADAQRQTVEAAGRAFGRQVRIVEASSDADLEKAFSTLAETKVAGLAVASNPLFNNLRDHVLALTTRSKLPAVYELRQFVAAGGLMSYGTSVPDVYRQIGVYAGRVLKGEKPEDLPVLEPTKFDMAINLRTAKALGIDMPTSILLRANEVIE
jgi:putative ABC transport system substrate-binding protein